MSAGSINDWASSQGDISRISGLGGDILGVHAKEKVFIRAPSIPWFETQDPQPKLFITTTLLDTVEGQEMHSNV